MHKEQEDLIATGVWLLIKNSDKLKTSEKRIWMEDYDKLFSEAHYSSSTLSEEKIDAHTKVSMDAYEKGFKHGKLFEKKGYIKDFKYEDGTDHDFCGKCGFCIDCGDCRDHGCGEDSKSAPKEKCMFCDEGLRERDNTDYCLYCFEEWVSSLGKKNNFPITDYFMNKQKYLQDALSEPEDKNG